jgi:hypothetical protein
VTDGKDVGEKYRIFAIFSPKRGMKTGRFTRFRTVVFQNRRGFGIRLAIFSQFAILRKFA